MAPRIVEPHGITLQQFNVLRILRGAGDEGLPTLEVADRMIEQTPGVTRLLDRMEAKELVRRQRCPKDRRQHLCWITAKGLALLEKIDPLTSKAHEESLKGLRQKDRVDVHPADGCDPRRASVAVFLNINRSPIHYRGIK